MIAKINLGYFRIQISTQLFIRLNKQHSAYVIGVLILKYPKFILAIIIQTTSNLLLNDFKVLAADFQEINAIR